MQLLIQNDYINVVNAKTTQNQKKINKEEPHIMRIFETTYTKEIIVLSDCVEKDIHDTKGDYQFTLVIGTDQDGNEQKIPKNIEITFNEINLHE